MPQFTEDWFSKNIPIWEITLGHLKGLQLEVIEIGSFEGRSTLWLLENILTNSESRITCVDTWDGGTDLTKSKKEWEDIEKRFLNNIKDYVDKVAIAKEDSAKYLKNRKERADIIYIDGSHYAANCLIDGVLAHLLLKPNGIIIFDDYLWDGATKYYDVPKAAIDAFLDCFAKEYEILSIGYQLVLRKRSM